MSCVIQILKMVAARQPDTDMEINNFINEVNIAKHLSEDKLVEISKIVSEGYDTDKKSRKDWEENLDTWTRMTLQITDKKTYPWPNASNVKFPLLGTAAQQFAARAYPTLVPANGDIVKCKVVGSDPQGEKEARAIRIGKHMSYQILTEMEEWEEEMDRLLIALPISGTVFKKTYYDNMKGRNVSCVIYPKNLVVNYWAKNLENAERKTEIIEMSQRLVKEKQLAGLYLDVELSDPSASDIAVDRSNPSGTKPGEDDFTTPYVILEQHTYLDLDDDGYPEPYIVVFEESSKKVLRIVARFSEDGVKTDEKGKILSIEPLEFYTKFSFFPNPDGGFYDIGFGRLLGSINESVDTLINQLIDAGTLSNLQSGFIGKGLRIKMGDGRFTPGEWKAVNATGSDIKSQIYPLPVREPSNVLFQLLELLSQSAKELASIAEIFVGKMPGQNTPATTTMASVQEGMRLFTAIYKRIYRSLGEEFRKLYKLNSIYLEDQHEIDILDEPIGISDYKGSANDITPAADPSAASQEARAAKAERLLQILQLGTIDPMEVTQRLLVAYEEPAPDKLMRQPPPPPPDPKIQAMQMKAQIDERKSQLDQAKAQHDMKMKEWDMQIKQADAQQKRALEAAKAKEELQNKAVEAYLQRQIDQVNAQQSLHQKDAEHAQKMQQSQEAHKVKVSQQSKGE